jgi:polysaccharide biosynthesis protein PslH
MHAVIVSEEPCYPPTAGNRIRALNLMLQMANRHQITYICRDQGNASEAKQAGTFLKKHGITTIVVADAVRSKKGPLFYFRLAENLLSSLPYSVHLHNSPGIHEAIHTQAVRNKVDLWQFEWLPYLDALRGLPGARSVVMAYDVIALVWQRYHEIERNPLRRWYIRQQWHKFQRFERRIYHQTSRVVAVTADDARSIQTLYDVPRVDVVDNGVDIAHFQEVRGKRNPHQILFLGALEYRPNQDGARLLLDQVFPAVKGRHPTARLVIVGRKPPDWLRQRVAGLSDVELHADVPDVRPYLAASAVLAVPLRVGGGSRIKILEALATGLPVVSTRVGAEGLTLTPERDLFVAEQPEEMTAALCKALDNPERTRLTAAHGGEVVRKHYDWSVLGEKLEQVWQSVIRNSS